MPCADGSHLTARAPCAAAQSRRASASFAFGCTDAAHSNRDGSLRGDRGGVSVGHVERRALAHRRAGVVARPVERQQDDLRAGGQHRALVPRPVDDARVDVAGRIVHASGIQDRRAAARTAAGAAAIPSPGLNQSPAPESPFPKRWQCTSQHVGRHRCRAMRSRTRGCAASAGGSAARHAVEHALLQRQVAAGGQRAGRRGKECAAIHFCAMKKPKVDKIHGSMAPPSPLLFVEILEHRLER